MRMDVKLPPGCYKNGTLYQSRGRWWDMNLSRFYNGAVMPWGGWVSHSASLVTGAARAMLTYVDNEAVRWIVIGTHSHLYAYDATGTRYDITPSGFTSGQADATTGGGYGNQAYGALGYGTPRTDQTNITLATVWSLDTWGEWTLGVSDADGGLWEWKRVGATAAIALTGANLPTTNASLVVTEERFIMALGANGNPRMIVWGDQNSDTFPTPDVTNQAGFFQLQTQGKIMCGRRVQGAVLIFTDQDMHVGVYSGPPLIYGFQQVGTNCGIVSRQAVIVANNQAAWMSPDGFWTYNGVVSPLESDVGDYVFNRLNLGQASKVFAIHNREFGEVTWFYPNGTEIDSYVTWNYRENHWGVGSLSRTCGWGASTFRFPLMVDASGMVWEHEQGFQYSGATPYVETGPLEMNAGGAIYPLWNTTSSGDTVIHVNQLIPDSETKGDVMCQIFARYYPNEPDTAFGPYSMIDPTDFRITGREIRLHFKSSASNDWRVGIPRLNVVQMGLR